MKVFIVSDTHFPFHDVDAYLKMMKLIKAEKPNVVIQIGDLLDQYVFSKYTRKMSITPDQDVGEGLHMANKFWEDVRKALPRVSCYQILGNHDVRITKRISEKLPEMAEYFGISDLYKFKGVKVLKSDRDFLTLDGVIYCHGWLSKSIDHAKHFNKPTVHGHRHRPCIEVDGPLWSMDVGYLADKDATPLSYTMSKHSRWRLACGIVEDAHPRLILLD